VEKRKQPTWLIVILIFLVVACVCVGITIWGGRAFFDALSFPKTDTDSALRDSTTAKLTIAVSPGMAPTFNTLVERFNAQANQTPDGSLMLVRTITVVPENMVEDSLSQPPFQALAPDSSLWLSQLDRRWSELQGAEEDDSVIPIGHRRFSDPVRYAVSPIVMAAWESTARELGWPDKALGWQDIQRKATADPNFKWNHPSTGHASGLLATLAEFYAGAGLTRGLTPAAATAQSTLDYVRDVEATVRFYGEGEDVLMQRLAAEGRNFLDVFVTQEQIVVAWNQVQLGEPLVAIYPVEGTLWADHPLALLELGGADEIPVSDNQRRTYWAFVEFITSTTAQNVLLTAGYRPADMAIRLDEGASPFVDSVAVDWRQPQTTLQIPSASVVEVVQNVWWYTKRPTNVYLVVDTSGSMEGAKMQLTQSALHAFIDQIQGDRDQVGLISFASGVDVLRALQPLDDAGRAALHRAVDGLVAQGNTALIDGVWAALAELQAGGNTDAINAIVVMTDGQENNSQYKAKALYQNLQQGTQVVVFTIAFGSNADEQFMRTMAETGGGQFRRASETDIEELYKIISTYF